MPRLNERNQAIGMLNAGMSATVVSRHCGQKPVHIATPKNDMVRSVLFCQTDPRP